MGNETLLRLINHTAVKAHIVPGVFQSIPSYYRKVDYLIGAIEEAAALLPLDRDLQSDYSSLRRDEEFKLYFSGIKRNGQANKQKNPANKSINGF